MPEQLAIRASDPAGPPGAINPLVQWSSGPIKALGLADLNIAPSLGARKSSASRLADH